MKILLANPRGFCAGVDRAIEIVERALDLFGAPIYVRHEVVHNQYVVNELRQKGAIFVEEIDDIPDNSTVIFSAHGVSQTVRHQAENRNLTVFDATCPLVTKVHMEVKRHAQRNQDVILIGHAGHPEVEGTMGQYLNTTGNLYLVEDVPDVAALQIHDTDNLAYVTQTTLSIDDTQAIIDALRQKFPNIQGPKRDDICYATQNRQDAVRDLAKYADVILVIGSKNSSNSNRLSELGERCGKPSYLIDDASELNPEWLQGKSIIGITAGASAPEILVQNLIESLKTHGADQVEPLLGKQETIEFSLPKPLRVKKSETVVID